VHARPSEAVDLTLLKGVNVAAWSAMQGKHLAVAALQVQQAAASLKLQLQPLLGGGKPKVAKGFGGPSTGSSTGGTRFAVELPVADTSPTSLAGLTQQILALAGASAGKGDVTMVFAEASASKAAAGAAGGRGRVLQLREACRADSLAGLLCIVAPSVADVGAGRGRLGSLAQLVA
jgi:hypothetical protein